MSDDDWSFKANLERGHLPSVVQCHKCDGSAWDLGDRIDCENCGIIHIFIEGE